MNDPIIEEVRCAREAYAARFNHDLDAIYRDLKVHEQKSGRKFASPAPTVAAGPGTTEGSPVQATPEHGAAILPPANDH
jgi:hypothetical protein